MIHRCEHVLPIKSRTLALSFWLLTIGSRIPGVRPLVLLRDAHRVREGMKRRKRERERERGMQGMLGYKRVCT